MQTILLVEGDAIIRYYFCKALSSEGYRVLEAESTRDALRVDSQHGSSIDLMVSGLRPPDLDGIALGVQMKSVYPHVRVLIVSSYTARELPSDAPYDGLLEMPVGENRLLRAVETLLRP